MTFEPKTDKWISDLVGTFTDPIIVMPGGWGDSLPDWIKTAITIERLIENIKRSQGEEPTGTDAEVCAYLFTASLTAPMSSDWTQIYLYIATRVYEKNRTKESGVAMPADVRVDQISDHQQNELNRLKRWLYEQRIKVRTEREHQERRDDKEKERQKAPVFEQLAFNLDQADQSIS